MARRGGKYQVGDRFIMKRSYGPIPKGEIVEVLDNLGKKDNRTYVKVRDTKGNVIEELSSIYLGKRVTEHKRSRK